MPGLQHYTRAIEQDLLPLTQRLTVDFCAVFGRIRAENEERDPEHVAKAALIALAAAAEGVRLAHGIPIEAWAQANRIAQTPSLSTTAELLPAIKQRVAAIKASA